VQLTTLARQIRAAHARGQAAEKDALQAYRAAGEWLLEAKAQVGHGKYEAWVADHCGFSKSTAEVYTRLARWCAANPQRAVHLKNLREWLAFIRGADIAGPPYTCTPARTRWPLGFASLAQRKEFETALGRHRAKGGPVPTIIRALNALPVGNRQ